MCRLLGALLETPGPLTSLMSPSEVTEFEALSHFHDDGWGCSWANPEGQLGLYKTDTPAYADPRFRTHLSEAISPLHIVHLRWASSGMANAVANCHPFISHGITLAHNGYIAPAAELEQYLDDDTRNVLEGTTDSERYLAIITQNLADGKGLTRSVQCAVDTLRDHYPHACLNALVSDGTTLIAVNINQLAHSPIEADGFDDEGREAPESHKIAYFPLRARLSDSAVIISSTGIGDDGWEPLAPESITEYRIERGKIHAQSILVPSRV